MLNIRYNIQILNIQNDPIDIIRIVSMYTYSSLIYFKLIPK